MIEPVIKKQKGVQHFFAAATYSRDGFRRLIKEAAFRHELVFFVVAMFALLVVGASLGELMIAFILFMVLFAVEAINTAIEEIIDRISPEISSVGKHAKDMGSFAVLCLLLACGLYLLFAIGRHFF